MKCQLCGKSVNKLFSGPNDIALCEECNTVYKQNKEEVKVGDVMNLEGEVIAEAEEIKKSTLNTEAEEEAVVNQVRCEITLGVLKDGRLYFNVGGDDPDLLVIDGLIGYGKRIMKHQWELRDAEIARAAAEKANS